MTSDQLLREWCEGRVTKQEAETEMDYLEHQRRTHPGATPSYRPEPDLFDRIWRRVINVSAFIFWTIVLKYAIFKGWPL